ncbi:MAG: hypothetical protein K5651_05165 [Bacteroidales bacterium]|nr:hypothetical protein [Bacteroidales bacterium]
MSKTKLSDSKMGRLVARLLGKDQLATKDGKVSLTDEEREKVRKQYGDSFLSKLEASSFEDAESASELFDAAVAHVTADLSERISQLQDTVTRLAAEPEPTPKAAAPKAASKGAPAGGFRIDMNAMHNRIASKALDAVNPAAAFAELTASGSALDVTDLNAELGAVMPAGVRLEVLTKRIYNGFNDAQHFTKVQSNTDYKASAALIGEVSQQFTPKWTPKGYAKFTPIVIKYRRHKINVPITPADIIPSWLLYMYEQGKTPSQMPIVKYIVEQHILPKVADDITLAMIGKGKFQDAGTVATGDAGKAASASMDGYETILVEGSKDSKCKINFFKAAANPFTMTDAQLLAYVDSFVDAISPLFAKHLELHCSPEFLTRYKRADFNINGKYTGMENGGQIRFTSFSLVPMVSMYGSPILFATPKENFVMLVDYSRAEACINKIEEQDYDFKVFGEYSLSTGFKIAEAVYAAVPGGYDPNGAVASDASSVSDAWANGGDASLPTNQEAENGSSSEGFDPSAASAGESA